MNLDFTASRSKIIQNLSSYLIMGLTIVVLASATFSEVFKNRNAKENLTELYDNPFNTDFLRSINSIQLKNDIIKVSLEKKQDWMMTSPRNLKADERIIKRILQTIKNIEIKKVYQKEPINLKSFSLDRPRVALTLKGDREYTINIGLINSIDNSTYISIDEYDSIYKITNMVNNIANIDIAALIDARIFPYSINEIKSFKVFKKNYRAPQLSFIKNEQGWANYRGRVMDPEKVKSYLEKIFSIESTAILDKQSEKNEQIIERYNKGHKYRVEIEVAEQVEAYTVTALIKDLPDVKFEKYSVFAILPEKVNFPKLVRKDQYWNFTQDDKKYRSLSIKKIIY